MGLDLRQGKRLSYGGRHGAMLRFLAVALLARAQRAAAARAFAEPLDKDACANLQLEQKKLLPRRCKPRLSGAPTGSRTT